MALIKSISGIRGTIGGLQGEGLTPFDICRFTIAFAFFLRAKSGKKKNKVVIGRDARISGDMVARMVSGTLMGCGVEVIDTGLSTTPTVELAVMNLKADGGIIITASHNPAEWNALKLLNSEGQFLSADEGQQIMELSGQSNLQFPAVENIGKYYEDNTQLQKHIHQILALPLVDRKAIQKAGLRIVVDAANSAGGIAIPALLESLFVREIVRLNCEPTGIFAHNPEPLPQHLGEISQVVLKSKADAGLVVDPDVDRLAIVMENGEFFGEEYTLVAVSDYVLSHNPGNTVSNLSSSRALQDVTEKYGGSYYASAVGEVNVVDMMKRKDAVIGGEGNGGVIYPPLHYGRDALAGTALFLSHLAKSGKTCSGLRKLYPDYYISKNKIELSPAIDLDQIFTFLRQKYKDNPQILIDGLRIEFGKEWVHLRKSNTEPIIRIYAESSSQKTADRLANRIKSDILR